MQAVILSFDSLAANSLGCYGNEWIETPNWDRLAATGTVFDSHFADSVGPGAGWRSQGSTSKNVQEASAQSTSLGRQLHTNHVATKLIVAGPIASWQQQLEFDAIQSVEGRDGADVPPDEVPVATLVKAGIAAWNDDLFCQDSRLLWLHSVAPGVPPTGFESLYFEDFEERGQVMADLSDDSRARHPAVYAGAVSLLDHWLGELMHAVLNATNQTPTLFIVTAAQGTLWHRINQRSAEASTAWCDALTDQCIRAPLVLSVCHDPRSDTLTCSRSSQLTQCHDLASTLIDWFAPTGNEVPSGGAASWLRIHRGSAAQQPVLHIAGEQDDGAVRTPDWLLIRDASSAVQSDSLTEAAAVAPRRVSLFAKPEDIWDVSDVASQYPEVVDGLLRGFPC